MTGSPYWRGVAPAMTNNQRGVMTPTPKETWLGLTRCTCKCGPSTGWRGQRTDGLGERRGTTGQTIQAIDNRVEPGVGALAPEAAIRYTQWSFTSGSRYPILSSSMV